MLNNGFMLKQVYLVCKCIARKHWSHEDIEALIYIIICTYTTKHTLCQINQSLVC